MESETGFAKENPWVKWFFDDWLNDEDLQPCSFAAQGLWMSLLGLMRRGRPYGFLQDKRGLWTVERIAGRLDKPIAEVHSLFEELERNNVFSRNDDGVPFCRRLVRDYVSSQSRSEAGKLGAIQRFGAVSDSIIPGSRYDRLLAARKLGTHTREQFQEMVEFFGGCVVCQGRPVTEDHIVPIAIGGSDDISNIQPLCRSCNSSKSCCVSVDYRLSRENFKYAPQAWKESVQ